MSIKKETKIEKVLDATQAAEFFHALGLAIASDQEKRLAEFGLALGDFEKIKLTFKKEGAVFILKAKVKEAETAPSGEVRAGMEPYTEKVPGELSYKTLKKRMKGDFAELKKMLAQDGFPRTETVRRFLDDSNRMTTFPGLGDEHYERYNHCCRELEKAVESGDLEAMRSSLALVEARKKACHEQYK